MSYGFMYCHYKMMARSAVYIDSELQVIRGAKLSSTTSDYIVQDLIQNGSFCNIAKCFKPATNETVAVRITKKPSAEQEEGILQKLKAFDPDIFNLVRWESSFIYMGHLCQVFEHLDISLEEFVNSKRTSSLPLKDIRPILHQMATALQVLKSLGIVHTHVTPKNIMLVDHVRQPLKVKLNNFASACEVSKTEQGSYTQSRWYSAPETILGVHCNEAIDMWSLGCIATELFLGYALYPGSCDYEMIWYITQTQGQLPGYFLNSAVKTSQFYLKTWPNMWKLMTPHEYGRIPCIDSNLRSLDELKEHQQNSENAIAYKAELDNFVEMVKQMLEMGPSQRITPREMLQHPFFTMSHWKDLTQNLGLIFLNQNKTELSTKQEATDNQTSTTFSEVKRSPQNLLLNSEKTCSMVRVNSMEKRQKRAYAKILQKRTGSPDSSSPVRKKMKIRVGRSLVKRRNGDIFLGSTLSPSPDGKRVMLDTDKKDTQLQELGSPEKTSTKRKKAKIICRGKFLVKKTTGENSSGRKVTPTPERKKMTPDSPEINFPVGMTLSANKTDIEELENSYEMSAVTKKAKICRGKFLVKKTSGENSSGSKLTPTPERKQMTKTLDTAEKDTQLLVLGSPDKNSAAKKKTKKCRGNVLVKRTSAEISKDSQISPSPKTKRVKMLVDTAEKDTDTDKTLPMATTQATNEKETQELESQDKPSAVRKKAKICRSKFPVRKISGENSVGGNLTPTPESKKMAPDSPGINFPVGMTLSANKKDIEELESSYEMSAVTKKVKICRRSFHVKKTSGENSSDCRITPSPDSKRTMLDAVEKDAEELGSPDKTIKTTPATNGKDTQLQENGSPCKTTSVKKKVKLCRGNFLVKRPCEENPLDSIITPSPERKKIMLDTVKKDISELGNPAKVSPVPNWVKIPRSNLRSGSKITPTTEKKHVRITMDTVDKDTEQPSTSQEAPTSIATSENETMTTSRVKKPVKKIWIIGSSYIKRGETAAQKLFGKNFGLKAKVEWFGKGGMRWSGIIFSFYAELAKQNCPPDILVVHAGGNDLGLMTTKELSTVMKTELTQLHSEFPSMAIAYSCINERQVWRYGRLEKINKDRRNVNSYMRKAVAEFDGEVIEHRLLSRFDDTIYLADGVHFSKEGNEIFLTSIFYMLKKILFKYH